MPVDWFYSPGGRAAQGPVSAARLKELASAGRLQPTDLVWREGTPEWVPARRVRGLFSTREERTPPEHPPLVPVPTERSYWVQNKRATDGPCSLATLRERLAGGTLKPQTLACEVGRQDWVSVASIIGLPLLPTATLLGVGRAERQASRVPTAQPWNPIAVVLLGLIFTPVWAGTVLAINAYRLGIPRSTWVPVAIGPGSLILDLILGLGSDSYWVDVGLYLGAIGLLAAIVVPGQCTAFSQLTPLPPAIGPHWVVPSVAGVPLAGIAFLVFVIVPLIPLEPAEVCMRVAKAKDSKAAEPYVTLNLLPALREMDKHPDESRFEFEATSEVQAPANVGGRLVGFRWVTSDAGQVVSMEGVFHVVERNGVWKVEDIIVTGANGQMLPESVSLAQDYRRLLAANQPAGLTPSSAKKAGTDPSGTTKKDSPLPANAPVAAAYALPKIGKGLAAIFVIGFVILAKVASLFERLAGGQQPDDDTSRGT